MKCFKTFLAPGCSVFREQSRPLCARGAAETPLCRSSATAPAQSPPTSLGQAQHSAGATPRRPGQTEPCPSGTFLSGLQPVFFSRRMLSTSESRAKGSWTRSFGKTSVLCFRCAPGQRPGIPYRQLRSRVSPLPLERATVTFTLVSSAKQGKRGGVCAASCVPGSSLTSTQPRPAVRPGGPGAPGADSPSGGFGCRLGAIHQNRSRMEKIRLYHAFRMKLGIGHQAEPFTDGELPHRGDKPRGCGDARGAGAGTAALAVAAAGPGGQTASGKTPGANATPRRRAGLASHFANSVRVKRYLGCLRNNKSQRQTIKFTITGVTEA